MVILRENVRTLTIQTGGRLPFTEETWSGKSRPGISLAYNQVFRTFGVVCCNEPSLVYTVKPVLPPGETYHIRDSVTGADMPAILLQGHTLFMFQAWWVLSQKVYIRLVTDGLLHTAAELETLTPAYAFSNYLLGTEVVDPTGVSAHIMDMTITNRGTKDLEGFFGFLAIETLVGSAPWPKKRTVVCKHCGAKTEVEYNITKVNCAECGLTTIYYPIVRGASIG